MPDPVPWPTPRAAADGALHLTIVPWSDPFLDRDDHDPRSPYAERAGGVRIFEPLECQAAGAMQAPSVSVAVGAG